MNTPIPVTTDKKTTIEISNLNFFYGNFQGLKNINLNI
ncbi:MAG: phosphate ABC transporter ATP-binding protein, partial [Burkholderiaceae bacterium]